MMINIHGAVLNVRRLRSDEVDLVVRYLFESPASDLDRMAIDQSRLTDPEKMREDLLQTISDQGPKTNAYYLAWEVDGTSIGFSSLKDIPSDRSVGGMHLHMWTPAMRGQGFGGVLFSLSALEFYKWSGVNTIICEPSSQNPLPNRMLQKVGFSLVKTHIARSSFLSRETELNRYLIDPVVATAYLEARQVQS